MDLKEFEKVKVKEIRKLYFPPVLDYDSVFAADFLSKEDLDICYTFLKEVFQAIREERESEYVILNKFLDRNGKAFSWLVSFCIQIENILGIEERIQIPFYKIYKDEELDFPPPYIFKTINKKGEDLYSIEPVNIRLKRDDVVNKYRVMYIKKCYEVTDFNNGYPGWYILQDTTVFEDYNIKTNKRVRIDYRNGEFLYFIAGASDNWQQIIDVPIEMDYVVSALLFRN